MILRNALKVLYWHVPASASSSCQPQGRCHRLQVPHNPSNKHATSIWRRVYLGFGKGKHRVLHPKDAFEYTARPEHSFSHFWNVVFWPARLQSGKCHDSGVLWLPSVDNGFYDHPGKTGLLQIVHSFVGSFGRWEAFRWANFYVVKILRSVSSFHFRISGLCLIAWSRTNLNVSADGSSVVAVRWSSIFGELVRVAVGSVLLILVCCVLRSEVSRHQSVHHRTQAWPRDAWGSPGEVRILRGSCHNMFLVLEQILFEETSHWEQNDLGNGQIWELRRSQLVSTIASWPGLSTINHYRVTRQIT